jgi:hypothetical protein
MRSTSGLGGAARFLISAISRPTPRASVASAIPNLLDHPPKFLQLVGEAAGLDHAQVDRREIANRVADATIQLPPPHLVDRDFQQRGHVGDALHWHVGHVPEHGGRFAPRLPPRLPGRRPPLRGFGGVEEAQR